MADSTESSGRAGENVGCCRHLLATTARGKDVEGCPIALARERMHPQLVILASRISCDRRYAEQVEEVHEVEARNQFTPGFEDPAKIPGGDVGYALQRGGFGIVIVDGRRTNKENRRDMATWSSEPAGRI